MKAGKALLIAGGIIAGVYAISKTAEAMGAGGAGAGGALGGSEDMGKGLEDRGGFAGIDPNAQYQNNEHFYINPDGSIVPIQENPDTGEVTTTKPDGSLETIFPASTIGLTSEPPAPQPSSFWGQVKEAASSPFTWVPIAGFAAYEAGKYGVKKYQESKIPKAENLVNKAEVKGVPATKQPLQEVRESVGLKGEPTPTEKIMQAKYVTDADISRVSPKVSEGITAPKTSEMGGVKKVTVGKAGAIAGEALIVGQVIQRSFGAWNEYGISYLPQDTKPTVKATAQAVGVTGVVASQGIATDIFNLATGVVYRPKTGQFGQFKQEEGTATGWFASEKDIWEAITHPKEALSGLTGYGEVKKALGQSEAASKPQLTSGNIGSDLSRYFGGIPSTQTKQVTKKTEVFTPLAAAPVSQAPAKSSGGGKTTPKATVKVSAPTAAEKAKAVSTATAVGSSKFQTLAKKVLTTKKKK
jgi:hypothetical protein